MPALMRDGIFATGKNVYRTDRLAPVSYTHLNRLHTLNARLSELRRPDRQQIGQTLNIKALLLETYDKRNHTL